MYNQQGVILIIVMIFLMMFSWLTMTTLDISIEAKKLAYYQRQHDQLFINADSLLTMAEQQILSNSFKLLSSSRLITDQQLQTDQIPPNIYFKCEEHEDFHDCYYIEFLSQQHCLVPQTMQPISINYYRISATSTINAALNQRIVVQNTFILMPQNIKQCVRSELNLQKIYSGRQSWREI